MKKKLFALLLCAALFALMLSGCGVKSKTATPYERLMAAQERFDPETTVFTVNGVPVRWCQYAYYLGGGLNDILTYVTNYAFPEDLNAEIGNGLTMRDYMSSYSESQNVYLASIHSKALERGITLDEQESAAAEMYLAQMLGGYASDEEAYEDLRLTPDAVRETITCSLEGSAIFAESYGLEGEKLSADEVTAWAEEHGYVHTKHILFAFTDENGEEKDKDALRTQLEEIKAELEALSGEEREAKFDEYMNELSDDSSALAVYPDGYTFTSGVMVEEFETAAFALSDHELSDIVETTYGYHLLLGLPIDPDAVTSDRDSNTGMPLSLRISAANDLYNAELADWINDAEIVWTPGFEELDFNDLFTVYIPVNGTLLIAEAVCAAALAVCAVVFWKKERAE